MFLQPTPSQTAAEADYKLPEAFPLEAWNEFPATYPAAVPLPMLEKSYKHQGFSTQVVSMHGVELLDEVQYDPTSTLLGLWFDKKGWFRGVARIKQN